MKSSGKKSNQHQWPNLFIAGEPRSGTTTLHDWLAQHPKIYMSEVKEPHYFSKINFPSPEDEILQITRDREKYLSLFEKAKSAKWRGESSTYYLADPDSPKLIKKAVPDAKIICVLRDPIERAYSHYLLYGRRGEQKLSFYETIGKILRDEKNDKVEPVYDLVELGRYHKHIRNYLKHFSRDQILIIFFDDLKKSPSKVLKQVFAFLDLDTKDASDIKTSRTKNPYSKPRNKFVGYILNNKFITKIGLKVVPRSLLRWIRYKILLKKSQKPSIDSKSKEILREIYKDEIADLEKLISRDCSVLRKID